MCIMYRVSQKKGWLVENGHCGPLGWARVKSRTIFEKIQEILYLIDTKIFQFDPLEAEKLRLKVAHPN